GRGYRGPEGDPLGRLRRRPEPDPRLARLARFPPGLGGIAAADAEEARVLGGDRLAQQLLGRALLVGAEVEVAHLPLPYAPRAQALPSSSYSRRKPSKRRRCPCSSRRIAITMSWVTGSSPSVSSTIRV